MKIPKSIDFTNYLKCGAKPKWTKLNSKLAGMLKKQKLYVKKLKENAKQQRIWNHKQKKSSIKLKKTRMIWLSKESISMLVAKDWKDLLKMNKQLRLKWCNDLKKWKTGRENLLLSLMSCKPSLIRNKNRRMNMASNWLLLMSENTINKQQICLYLCYFDECTLKTMFYLNLMAFI